MMGMMQETESKEAKESENEIITLVILSGLARPGDTKDQIAANISTAKEYSKAVFQQWEVIQKKKTDLLQIRHLGYLEESLKNVLEDKNKKLQVMKGKKEETLRFANSFIEDLKNPATDYGRELVRELKSHEEVIALIEKDIENIKSELEEASKNLQDLKGVPAPVPAPTPVPTPTPATVPAQDDPMGIPGEKAPELF
jgi:hypothetical protein